MNDEELKNFTLYPTAIYLLLVNTMKALANQGVIDIPKFIDDISHCDLHPDAEEALRALYKDIRQGVVVALSQPESRQQ